ncbi:ATP-binding protein [Actinoplanes sp. NPDC026619]|uniref:ATP-binding protein n=1 Tax=Actinoplanes sp. NPDC026619 TaxID=3155798 RepID=UPI0033DCDE78
MPLSWTARDEGGLVVVAVRGCLDLPGAPRLQTALLECLAEQPAALLLELSGLELAEDAALALFAEVAEQSARWPGAPLLPCDPAPRVAALLERGGLTVYRSVAEARVVVDEAVPGIGDQILPIAGAARHARNLATEACAAWDLPHLVGPACLVVSELVSNAVEHAGTMITVRLTRRAGHLHIAVRDGSAGEPVERPVAAAAERGRGLMLVSTVATDWGWLPARDGKVVRATLNF